MQYTFPNDYEIRKCYLVAINASLIPLVAGRLHLFEERRAWHNDEEYHRGYNAIAELEACFMKLCVDDLIESNDRLYRLLDTALFGTEYTVVSTDPLEVSPEIQPTHNLEIIDQRAMLGRIRDLQQLLQNALNGTATDNYSRPQGVRDLLESMLAALQEQGNLDPEILARLVEIVGLLA